MRGRYHHRAVQLYQRAAGCGDASALWHLARLREQAADSSGAEALAVQAADLGDIEALWHLAWLRERARDTVGAEALYRQAVDRGDADVLRDLARLRDRAGDRNGAERIRQLGLADDGSSAASLDFDHPDVPKWIAPNGG